MRVARAPRLTALDTAAAGAARLELRPVAIEDLLNRPQVPLDREGMARLVQGRRVLVTGAGGTIGSELARQVAALGPAQLVLLDNGEFALWQIDIELAETPSRRAAAAPCSPISATSRAAAPADGGASPRAGVPRRGAEARADGGGEPAGGAADQRRRHPPRGRRGARGRGAGDGADLHRQGGEPVLADGRVEAAGGDVLPGARHRRARPGRRHALHHRAVRQRAGQHRQRGAAVPAPARPRRAADRDPSRHAALFHDGARGGRAGAAGQRGRQRRRGAAATAAFSCSTWASR